MRVLGYAYSADLHCPRCARHDADCGILTRQPPLHMGTDEHGLALDLVDSEGNPVHPVFSTDEAASGSPACGACREPL